MTESYIPYRVSLSLWPAASLSADMAQALGHVGVDLSRLEVNNGRLSAVRAVDGAVVLKLSLDGCCCGLTDVEGILATARLDGLGYVAWEFKPGEITGIGRSYDPLNGEREFTVLTNGGPVFTLGDLEAFEHVGTAEALLRHMRSVLRLPEPQMIEELALGSFSILIEDDEEGGGVS
jgi:hypothetical protein